MIMCFTNWITIEKGALTSTIDSQESEHYRELLNYIPIQKILKNVLISPKSVPKPRRA